MRPVSTHLLPKPVGQGSPRDRSGPRLATISETLNIGRELRRELEVAAQRGQRDATNLGRKIIGEWLDDAVAEP